MRACGRRFPWDLTPKTQRRASAICAWEIFGEVWLCIFFLGGKMRLCGASDAADAADGRSGQGWSAWVKALQPPRRHAGGWRAAVRGARVWELWMELWRFHNSQKYFTIYLARISVCSEVRLFFTHVGMPFPNALERAGAIYRLRMEVLESALLCIRECVTAFCCKSIEFVFAGMGDGMRCSSAMTRLWLSALLFTATYRLRWVTAFCNVITFRGHLGSFALLTLSLIFYGFQFVYLSWPLFENNLLNK